jgi:hypothetical protein
MGHGGVSFNKGWCGFIPSVVSAYELGVMYEYQKISPKYLYTILAAKVVNA